MDVSLGFLVRVRRAALFLSTTLSDASLRPSPALSSLRGLSLKSLQLAHLAGKESFARLLAFDPADANQKSPASSSNVFAMKNIARILSFLAEWISLVGRPAQGGDLGQVEYTARLLPELAHW